MERSSYCKYTKIDRAEIGRDAAKHGVANAVQKSKQRFLTIKQKYLELKNTDPSEPITEIQTKKRVRPSLLPDEIMTKTVDIIKTSRLKAAPISYLVMVMFARGSVLLHGRNVLVENGGHLRFILYKVKTERTRTEYHSLYFEKVLCIFDISKRQKTNKYSFR